MGGIWGSIFETYLYYFPISDYMLLRFCYQQLQQSDVTYCIIYTCVRFTWNNIVWYPQLSAMSFYLINTFIHLHKFIIETIYMYRHVSLGSTFITLLLQLANFYPPVYLFNAHPNPTSPPPPPPHLCFCSGPSSLALVRELLLVLQWTSFQHNPSDIQLLFDGNFLSKILAFSGVVTPTSCGAMPTDSRLCSALQQGCEQLLKLLALRVG